MAETRPERFYEDDESAFKFDDEDDSDDQSDEEE